MQRCQGGSASAAELGLWRLVTAPPGGMVNDSRAMADRPQSRLDAKLAICYYCHNHDDATPDPTRAPSPDMGRQTPARGAQAVGSQGRCPAPSAPRARRTPPSTRDTADLSRATVASHGPDLPGRPPRAGTGVARRSPSFAVLGPARSRPSPRRGTGRPRALPRAAGTRHTHREGCEPHPRTARSRLERQISCASPEDAARSQECSRLCASQLEKTCAWRARARLALVRHLVSGLAGSDPVDEGTVTGRRTQDVACSDRLAAPRANSSRRTASARTWTTATYVTAAIPFHPRALLPDANS